ncbi:uncharacterized protein BO87DRAFT_453765, partial [Aspergillus neoniger CBS 115656]
SCLINPDCEIDRVCCNDSIINSRNNKREAIRRRSHSDREGTNPQMLPVISSLCLKH